MRNNLEQNEKDKQLSINFQELGGHLHEDSKIHQIIDRIDGTRSL
jgi:hypothetical protein